MNSTANTSHWKAPAPVQMGAYRPLVASTFGDGSLGVQPHWTRLALALLVDTALVAGLVAAVCVSWASLLSGNPLLFGFMVAGAILLVPWLAGFLCHRGHTPGTLLAGTKLVRLRDGTAPGVWRGGWLMFARTVLILLVPVSALLDMWSGGTHSGIPEASRDFHVSIDKRRTAGLLNGCWSP